MKLLKLNNPVTILFDKKDDYDENTTKHMIQYEVVETGIGGENFETRLYQPLGFSEYAVSGTVPIKTLVAKKGTCFKNLTEDEKKMYMQQHLNF
jgi:hypothetical protein